LVGAVVLSMLAASCRSTEALPISVVAEAKLGQPVTIRGTNSLRFEPALIEAENGPGVYTLRFENVAAIGHDITFSNGQSARAEPNQTVDLEVEVPPGGLAFICTVRGHFKAGMSGRIFTGEEVPEEGDVSLDEFPAVDPADLA